MKTYSKWTLVFLSVMGLYYFVVKLNNDDANIDARRKYFRKIVKAFRIAEKNEDVIDTEAVNKGVISRLDNIYNNEPQDVKTINQDDNDMKQDDGQDNVESILSKSKNRKQDNQKLETENHGDDKVGHNKREHSNRIFDKEQRNVKQDNVEDGWTENHGDDNIGHNKREHSNRTFENQEQRNVKHDNVEDDFEGKAYTCHAKDRTVLSGYETEKRDNDLIMYSEMGKCGSGTLIAILARACAHTRAYTTKYTIPLPWDDQLPTIQKRLKYVKDKILSNRKPYIFTGHSSFIDFKELGLPQPLYIDLIRDPINTWISLFYYMRRSQHPGMKDNPLEFCIKYWIETSRCENAADMVHCLTTREFKGCDHGYVSPGYKRQFSGRYINSSDWTVENAKRNIERYYAFIGINEHYTETLKGLEKVIPKFKAGVLTEVYKSIQNRNVGKHRPPPTNATVALMKELLADDYTIYYFVRQRFYTQLKCLGIKVDFNKKFPWH